MVSNILSRRREDREKWGDRLPPGQKVVEDWPVLTYGGTPRVDLKSWRLRLFGLVEKEAEFSWEDFTSLPTITVHCDVHCVTSWSRMDNVFEGVAFLNGATACHPDRKWSKIGRCSPTEARRASTSRAGVSACSGSSKKRPSSRRR